MARGSVPVIIISIGAVAVALTVLASYSETRGLAVLFGLGLLFLLFIVALVGGTIKIR